MQENNSTHGIKMKDKIGYALGDTAGLLTFGIITPFQLMFYTDVLGINPGQASLLLLVARIWDAVNDPMWGAFIDSRKPTKYGRFRPYILGFSIPLAIAGVLMFTKMPGLTAAQYLVYAYVTYIFYGMMYTCVNIPFGSLASVITDDEIERASLSMWRSIGAGLGGLPAQILMPLFVYSINDAGNKVLDSRKFFIAVAAVAALSIVVYFAHFKMTKERVVVTKKKSGEKYNIFKTVGNLITNKEFMVVGIASMLLIAFQQYTQTYYNYLFKDYFEKPGLFSLVTICTYLPMAVFIPFMGKLIRKYGKKEICAAGLAFSSVINVIMYLLRFTPLCENPYVFLALCLLSGAGQTFLVLEVWALVMDVIDYHELRTGRQEEGSCYSIFSFMRKLGQTLAGSGSAALLGIIGYNVNSIGNQGEGVLTRLYDASTLVPAIVLAVMFALLGFFYKFNKQNLEIMRNDLEAQRKTASNAEEEAAE